MWYDSMFKEIEASGDEAQSVKMAAYMKNNFRFIGIPKPRLNSIIKPYIKEARKIKVDWDFITVCWEKNYREAQYAGTDYIMSVAKQLTDKDLPRIRQMITTKSWWDVADNLDKIIGVLSIKYTHIHDEMLRWSESDNMWLRRVAIDYQQKLKDRTDTHQLETIILNNLNSKEFFINKAIGWALREYSATNPEWVSEFVELHRDAMNSLSIRESLKNITKFM